MDAAADRHVFVSYVREDSAQVDKLCAVLAAAGIPYWKDREKLGPGDEWKRVIRDAIKNGALAFAPCFSQAYADREKSQMNEEITLAVEEYRLRPPGRPWLFPIRFDGSPLPEWDLGAGRTLGDLNWADLHGEVYTTEIVKLVQRIQALFGSPSASSAAAVAVVRDIDDQHRGAILRERTKEMLLAPSARIALDDLIGQEVARVVAAIRDTERFPLRLQGGADLQGIVELAARAEEYMTVVEPFCASLQVAARWADPDRIDPWVTGLRSLYLAGTTVQGGLVAASDLRTLPVVAAVHVAGVAAIPKGRWANLRTLVGEPTVRDPRRANVPGMSVRQALVESIDPWRPFGNAQHVAHLLAGAAQSPETSLEEIAGEVVAGRRGFRNPVSDWLRRRLHPLFVDQFGDDDEYESAFDRVEGMFGTLDLDLKAQRPQSYLFTNWFGSAVWRYRHVQITDADEVCAEIKAMGPRWAPLAAGLFGGSAERALSAAEKYKESFDEQRRAR